MRSIQIKVTEGILIGMILLAGMGYLLDSSNTGRIKFSKGNKMKNSMGEYRVIYHEDVKKWSVENEKTSKSLPVLTRYFDTEKEAYLALKKLMNTNKRKGIFAYAVIPNKKEISDIFFEGFNN